MRFEKGPPKNFKLYISPYRLRPKAGAAREGALLAFHFKGGLLGYSDFLPWPGFGESALGGELRQIKKGVFSQRFLLAQTAAFLDAKARSKKTSLFFGLKIPDSHFLIEDLLSFKRPELIRAGGFKKAKAKLKPWKIPEQAEKLRAFSRELRGVMWRLDLNGMSWRKWRDRLGFLKESLDFAEDPLLEKGDFDKNELKLFAADWLISPYFKTRVVKPSRDRLDFLVKELARARWKRVVFTHSLDHPLGQAISAFWAGEFYKSHPRLFETGGLSRALVWEKSFFRLRPGKAFQPPGGAGFGFGDLLKKEKWRRWL